MFLLQAADPDILDQVYRYGALPLLLISVILLWRKTEKLETKLEVLNEAQKTDLRSHGEEVKGLQQSTLNTLNDYKSSLDANNYKIDELIRKQ